MKEKDLSERRFQQSSCTAFVGEDIDLRIFLNHWKFVFAVLEGEKKSLQFFGKDGLALHKIYLTKDSNEAAFDVIVEKFRAEDQNQALAF